MESYHYVEIYITPLKLLNTYAGSLTPQWQLTHFQQHGGSQYLFKSGSYEVLWAETLCSHLCKLPLSLQNALRVYL